MKPKKPKKPKRMGWRQHYSTDLITLVVLFMEAMPEVPYQVVLKRVCEKWGVEYRH